MMLLSFYLRTMVFLNYASSLSACLSLKLRVSISCLLFFYEDFFAF